MVRQRIAECSASSTAQAIASPSRVAVPRPISSTTTSERGPAWCRIAAVSVISTMKVRAPARQVVGRADPAEQPIHHADVALSAGTGSPAWASTTISAFCRRNVDLPAMFGPVSSSTAGRATGRNRSARRRAGRPARLPPRDAGRPDRELIAVGHLRAAPVPASASSRADWTTSSDGERVGAGGERSAWPASPHQLGEYRAFARRGAFAASEMRRSRSESSGVVKRAPLAMPWRRVSSGMVAQLLDRRGGRLDDVAELGVVADLQAGDAVALRVVELERGDAPGGCRRAAPARRRVPRRTRADDVAVVQTVGRRVGERVGQRLRQRRIEVRARPSADPLAEGRGAMSAASAFLQRRAARAAPSAQRGKVPRVRRGPPTAAPSARAYPARTATRPAAGWRRRVAEPSTPRHPAAPRSPRGR